MKVLMVSPHFPPDSSAGTHRVRLLASHLGEHGWTPTVLTMREEAYEGRLDAELAALVPRSVRVERCGAISSALTRKLGFGDLGIRSLPGLWFAAKKILSAEKHDAIFITIYPTWPALLGPAMKRRFGIPFVLDYQDPWVGEWGASVGGGEGGYVDMKSRLTRRIAMFQEARVVPAADAITAVSAITYENVFARIPQAKGILTETIPIGGDEGDFEYARAHPRRNPVFDPDDGLFHMCCTGTILPLGMETLRATLKAVAAVRQVQPDLHSRFRLHFVGTSNQSDSSVMRVAPIAHELGVGDCVTEHPGRVDYLDAIALQVQASANLLMGSSEHHYTASKLYPALLAGRPILAAYHSLSTVSTILRGSTDTHLRLVEYDDALRAEGRVAELAAHIVSLVDAPRVGDVKHRIEMDQYSAQALAGKLARVLDHARMRS